MLQLIKRIQKAIKLGMVGVLVVGVFVCVISIFIGSITNSKAQLSIQDFDKQQTAAIYKLVNDPELQKTKFGKTAITGARYFLCSTTGETCDKNPDSALNDRNKSISAKVSNLVALPMKYPVASGITSMAVAFDNAGFVPKSHALTKGIGFAALQPLEPLWKLFRNISFLILIIVMLVIGILIMFRFKIDPQTVIGIENSIPKIILAIILITFSIAIAGFLIDLMYLVIGIVVSLLSHNSIMPFDSTVFQTKVFNHGSSFVFDSLMRRFDYLKVGDSLLGIFPWQGQVILRSIAFIVIYALLGMMPLTGDIVSGAVLNNVGGVTGGLLAIALRLFIFFKITPYIVSFIPSVISFLIYFTALFVFFRIFFMVFRAYLEILLMVIFAPIILLFEAVPGKGTFTFWVMNIIGNLLVFPIVILITILSTIILAMPNVTGKLWAPPLYASFEQNTLTLIIGISLMFMIPDIVKMVKEALGIKGLSSGIGMGILFGGVGAGASGGMGIIQQYSSIAMALHYTKDLKNIFGGGKKGGP